MSTVGGSIDASKVKETTGSIAWYAWVVIVAVIGGVLGYGSWEWRAEIKEFIGRYRRSTSNK